MVNGPDRGMGRDFGSSSTQGNYPGSPVAPSRPSDPGRGDPSPTTGFSVFSVSRSSRVGLVPPLRTAGPETETTTPSHFSDPTSFPPPSPSLLPAVNRPVAPPLCFYSGRLPMEERRRGNDDGPDWTVGNPPGLSRPGPTLPPSTHPRSSPPYPVVDLDPPEPKVAGTSTHTPTGTTLFSGKEEVLVMSPSVSPSG